MNAHMESTWYGWKRIAKTTWGTTIRIPYCSQCYQITRHLNRVRGIFNNLYYIALFMLLGGCLSLLGFKATGLEIWVRLLLGFLLFGGLLFPAEPLFRLVLGIFLPLFLKGEVRSDLRIHLRNWGLTPVGYYAMTGTAPYSLGVSLKYDTKDLGRGQLVIGNAKMGFTNSEYARLFLAENRLAKLDS